jgi:hypothetical protein
MRLSFREGGENAKELTRISARDLDKIPEWLLGRFVEIGYLEGLWSTHDLNFFFDFFFVSAGMIESLLPVFALETCSGWDAAAEAW